MPQMIFVNLPVTDLEKSIAFYQAVGAVKDERFCDGSAAMMTFSDTISVMLLTHERFSQFTDRRIVDAHTSAQVLNCLSRESRNHVDETAEKAGTAGRAASVIAVDAAIYCRPGECATWCDVPSASGAAHSSEATPSFGAASCSVSVGATLKPLSVVGTHNHESTS